jgi:type I restriction enzyme S subunit
MPDDWKESSLDSICDLIIKGITPKYTDDSDQLVINQKCVRNHQVDLSLARPHIPKKINEKWLKYGDILVNSTGTGTLGRAAQVLFTPNNLTVDSHVTIIRASKAEYVYFLGLWATSHEHDFEMLQTGSTGQTDLPRERLKQMPVILPSDDILCKFSEIIKPIADIRIKNQQENQSLAALRDTLLPKLMNGEIDVSEVEI